MRMGNRRKIAGQSMVEFVIWGSVFMVVLVSLPMVAKISDIKNKHMEATRYAVWERTVWSSDRKQDSALAAETDLRVMGHPVQALTATGRQPHPFWTHRGKEVLQGEQNNSANSVVTLTYKEAPGENAAVKEFAYDSSVNLKLEGRGVATVSVQTSIIDRYNEDGQYVEDTNDVFTMESNAAILTDAWSLDTEGQYKDRVDDLALIKDVVSPVAAFGEFAGRMLTLPGTNWFYGEGRDASDVSLPVYSEVIDDKYVKDKPD